MKQHLIFTLLSLFILVIVVKPASGQTYKSHSAGNKNVHQKNSQTLIPAMFPCGTDSLYKFLDAHTKYPPAARENNIQGTVWLSFFINEEGAAENVKIIRDIGGGCGKEAIRVIQSMPLWKPATYKGRPVKTFVKYPVQFHLGD
jgi:TonB family protein